MSLAQRRSLAAAAMCGLLAVVGLGCSHHHHSPLADQNAELSSGIDLPEGFYPLRGQYAVDSPDDNYDGWPRYIVSSRDNMMMAYVPAQSFTMGGGIDADEVPARKAVVNHFYIDVHEVTNTQFYRFAKNRWSLDDYKDYWEPGVNNDHPVRNVSWRESARYARWIGKTLPTEAEWEAAARGGDARLFPWGNEDIVEHTRFLCNHRTLAGDFDGYEYTAPVLNYAAGVSPYGVYNMAGNVWEWCADQYDPGRYAFPGNEDPASGLRRGDHPFGDENYINPIYKDIRETRVGPLRGDRRVLRGGSYAEPIEACRTTARSAAPPDAHRANVGFRCVLPLPPRAE